MEFARHVRWRSEKFGAVIFDTMSEKVYVTNETGNDILGLIAGGLSATAAGERLEKEYTGDGDKIRSEVAAFVEALRTSGLLASEVEVAP